MQVGSMFDEYLIKHNHRNNYKGEFKMSFAENLKLIRKEQGITQEDLAEMLKVSRQAVSKWEAGAGNQMLKRMRCVDRGYSGVLPLVPAGRIGGKPAGTLRHHTKATG